MPQEAHASNKGTAALAALLAVAALAAAETPTARMRALMREATAMARTGTPIAASLEVVKDSRRDTGRLFVGPEGQAAFVLAGQDLRVLALPNGKAYVARGSEQGKPAAVDEPLGDLGIAPSDLLPFNAGLYRNPHITDDNPAHMLLTLEPAARSAYVITVVAIDKQKKLPTRIQRYAGSTNNLVRLSLQRGFVEVGGAWRATQIEISDYRDDTETRISLHWEPGTSVPAGVFDPEAFVPMLRRQPD